MSDRSTWKVLLVQGEKDGMDIVREVLHHYNVRIWAASSAEAAFDLMQHVQPTLLILDLVLPTMDGWALLHALRSTPETAAIPAVAVTAYHSSSVAQQAIRTGFDAYFPKPIEATSFMCELDRILSSQ